MSFEIAFIITTGLAGSLFWPYKGLLPACVSRRVENSSNRTFFTGEPKGSSSFRSYFFTFSPVNGSIYSLMLI